MFQSVLESVGGVSECVGECWGVSECVKCVKVCVSVSWQGFRVCWSVLVFWSVKLCVCECKRVCEVCKSM